MTAIWSGGNPVDGQQLVLPVSHDARRHDCYLLGCADPVECIRARRLADMFCVCGAHYGFGRPLVYRERVNRWYHAECDAVAAAASPLPHHGNTPRTPVTRIAR